MGALEKTYTGAEKLFSDTISLVDGLLYQPAGKISIFLGLLAVTSIFSMILYYKSSG